MLPLFSRNSQIIKIMNNNNQVLFDATNVDSKIISAFTPFYFKSNGNNLTNYEIYGNDNGVGNYDSITQKYLIPIKITGESASQTITLSLDAALMEGQKITLTDTNINIPTYNGRNIITIETETQPAMILIKGQISFISIETKSIYTINYYNGSTLLGTEIIEAGLGERPQAKGYGSTPTKASTAQYTYTFAGWSENPNATNADENVLTNITSDKTLYAVFTETTRTYTVYFYEDSNDTEPIQTVNNVPYGGSATYTGSTPEKQGYGFTGWSPQPTNISGDTSCYAQFEKLPYITDSWETIDNRGKAGTAQNYYQVGDCKPIELNGTTGTLTFDHETLYVYILGFNHNSTYEPNGITFGGFKTAATNGVDVCLVDSHYNSYDTSGSKWFNMSHWGYSNYGGWKGCDMRYDILGSTDVAPSQYGQTPTASNIGYDASSTCATNPVANTLMSCLPSDLRAVMKPMTKYSDNTGNSSNVEANVTASIDYLPLLSEYEVQGERSYANQYEQNKQARYAYYITGNSKVKYEHSNTSSAANWWCRSAECNYSYTFCYVFPGGSAGNHIAFYSRGVAPIFLVGTAPTYYTVSYYSQDGQTLITTEQVEEGYNCTYSTIPTKESDTDFDYTFVGWSTTTNSTTATTGATEDIQQNTNLYAAFSKSLKGDTISDSWEEIIANCDNGTYASKYQIGDLKTIDVGTEGPVQMQIVAIDTDLLASDNIKKAPITWISKQLLNTYKQMHSTSSNYLSDWANCTMRTYLRNTILPMLPPVVQNGIKEVTKYTNKRIGKAANTTVYSTENIWLPSYREVSNDTSHCETSGVQYNSIFTSDNTTRVKSKVGNSAYLWWTRSASGTSDTSYQYWFARVWNAGGANYSGAYCTESYGVTIGFCT